MDKPQPLLRQLHPCGPNCELLNQVGKDLANLRELVPKLDALHKEDPENALWQRRHAEAASMLVDYEVRYASMVKVREKALKIFRRLRPTLGAENIRKERQATQQRPFKPELEDRFQSLIDELEDLVFEFAVTEGDEETKRAELLTLVDSLSTQIQMVATDLGLDRGSAAIREAALQMAKTLEEAQTTVEESKASPSKT
ncbi:MAG: hypothetical protein H7Y17_03180 [Chlorobia bacterium]|nr:hypothetical protein [Fimbriimonadaceae bacterium]